MSKDSLFVLEVNSTSGNIFLDKVFDGVKRNSFEKLRVSRAEMEKRILRKNTDHGTDVGLKLNQGVKIHHGDIIQNGEKKIIIEQIPEKTITVKIKNKNNSDIMILLGHIIGNRHRPIFIQDDEVSFPIQADSEKEVFVELFSSIIDNIEITVKEQVFHPHSDADTYEHG